MNLHTFIGDSKDYSAVYGEVIRNDIYRLGSLDFTPDVVFDIGANTGAFTALAKLQWPRCRVIAVEPHPSTCAIFLKNVGHLPGVTLVQAAIARGPVFLLDDDLPECKCYHSETIGYSTVGLASDSRYTHTPSVRTVLLPDIIPENPGRFIVKLDCEGGESVLFEDIASTEILRHAEYITGEIHFMRRVHQNPTHGATVSEHWLASHGDVIRHRFEWFYRLTDTHTVEIELHRGRLMTWCRKK